MPTARVAKLPAKSFFRDLAPAGFEFCQMIEVASKIIALISTDIRQLRRGAD
jgi:hypothetical protein